MNTPTKITDPLTATISFRLSEDEFRTLNVRADRENRTVSTSFACCYRCTCSTPSPMHAACVVYSIDRERIHQADYPPRLNNTMNRK